MLEVQPQKGADVRSPATKCPCVRFVRTLIVGCILGFLREMYLLAQIWGEAGNP